MNIQSTLLDKRELTLQAALDLFVAQGLQQTSMSQISKVSGVAVGTIYHHFESKSKLIEELFLSIKAKFGASIELSKAENALDFKSKFKLLWMKAYYYYVEHEKAFYFVNSNNYSAVISTAIRNKAEENYKPAIQIVQEGITDGYFKVDNMSLIVRWINNNVFALVQLQLSNELEVAKSVLDQAFEMSWKSLT